jgi:ABC-type transport system involved in multi-copper enzyme maturation permease subunit
MTAANPATSVSASEPPVIAPAEELAKTPFWMRVEEWLDRLGDKLNPILVKEARQAMKSRQFVITFTLLLACGWLWTLLFIAFSIPAVYYAPYGAAMLVGYYIVLTVPLLIVVPYSSFRSLAAECEDGTYELLSITTLSAWQIITGKLGSSLLQMLVYYSALAPCIAFTYLLRGIDVVTIALYLGYTFLASLMLCIIGLMLATVTRSRHWQVLLSVVFVMALLIFGFIWDMSMFGIMGQASELPYDQADFWIANAMVLSFYTSFAVLFLSIAAGQITFASENRSTRLRVVLLTQQVLLTGWIMYGWLRSPTDDEWLYFEAACAGILWIVAGTFLAGETAQLSPRARRQLPHSFLGRMAFTWFNPGSGTGYVFAVLNLTAAMLMIAGKVVAMESFGIPGAPGDWVWLEWTLCIWGYVVGYLGISRLTVVLLRRVTQVRMMVTFLFQLLYLLAGIMVPLMIQGFLSRGDFSTFDFSPLHVTNWVWTLIEIGQGSSVVTSEITLLVTAAAALIFLANLVQTSRGVEQVRQEAPQRVLEEERLLHPKAAVAVAKSPWD